jgi:FAD/FMN-containing dehydrogenase
VLLDTSLLDTVDYDPSMDAFEVGPGARLLHVYERLSTGWGVTIPGGICHSVGAGGHIAGGGYGLLPKSRTCCGPPPGCRGGHRRQESPCSRSGGLPR